MNDDTAPALRWAPALAWTLWALSMGLTVAGLWLLDLTRAAPRPDPTVLDWATVADRMVFTLAPAVGAVIAARRPRVPIGWLLLVTGLGFPLVDAAEAYARHAIWTDTALPGWQHVAWLTNWAWALTPATLPVLLLLFPTGHPLSPRWRRAVRFAWGELALLVLVLALTPGPLDMFPTVTNPLGLPFLPALDGGQGLAPHVFALFLGLEAVTVVGLVGLVLRYRRAVGEERLQIKWVAWGAAMLVTAIVIGPHVPDEVSTLTEAVGGLALAGALAAALLRYRLYEIDRLVSRTVTYALVTGILLAVYTASVLAMRPVLAPLTGGSDLAVAGSTLVVAAAFGPLRRRVQAVVDRRFNRRQYDAARAVEAFGQRLRDEVGLDQLESELRRAVGTTVQPTTAALWVVPTASPAP